MKRFSVKVLAMLLSAVFLLMSPFVSAVAADTVILDYVPLSVSEDPVSLNPLKGFENWSALVADEIESDYWGDLSGLENTSFGYSLEFIRLPVSALVQGVDSSGDILIDWDILEDALDEAQAKGRNSVLRFYMSDPNEYAYYTSGSSYRSGMPDYLFGTDESNVQDVSLLVPGYSFTWKALIGAIKTNTDNPLGLNRQVALDLIRNAKTIFKDGNYYCPNYVDSDIQECILQFAEALKIYDGDSRIAAIEAGLLGPWGEWIDSGEVDLIPHMGYGFIASEVLYLSLMDIFLEYDSTHILIRNTGAASSNPSKYSPFGLHNDVFGVVVLTDNTAVRWPSKPIGGELAPLFQSTGFGDFYNESFFAVSNGYTDSNGATAPSYIIQNEDYGDGELRTLNYESNADVEHTSWLLVRRAAGYTGTEAANAASASALLGYDFAVTEAAVSVNNTSANVGVKIQNRGIAPFYYNWPVYIGIYDGDTLVGDAYQTDWDIREIEADGEVTFEATISDLDLSDGDYSLRMQIPNPMEGGYPITFANEEAIFEDGESTGWINLGSFTVDGGGTPPANPPVPSGFFHKEGTVDTGFVIENSTDGNQFVWIPASSVSAGSLTATSEFSAMAASVAYYGGFYVGRYETGNLWNNQTPVVKAYDIKLSGGGVTWLSVYDRSAELYASNPDVVSGMLWNEQWEAILDWVGTSNYDGNYKDSGFVYYNAAGTQYTKAAGTDSSIPTGSAEISKLKNIYDLAGNMWEMVVTASGGAVSRGGCYRYDRSASNDILSSSNISAGSYATDMGSRMQLYLVPQSVTPPSSPYVDSYVDDVPIPVGFTHVTSAGSTKAGGIVIQDANGNQFVWIPASSVSAGSLTATSEFSAMAESVSYYGGFYVGRYETGNLWNNQTPVVKAYDAKLSGSGVTWQSVYDRCAALYPSNASVVGGMLWNEQWNAVVSWVGTSSYDGNYLDSGFDYYNAAGTQYTKAAGTASAIPTGGTEISKLKNIYDLAGNMWEMVVAADGNGNSRGGCYKYNKSAGNDILSSLGTSSGTYASDIGSRMQLYLKVN
ncbi:MAG: DUF4832 domain-containing protein [Oscillospiraceae bacterium]|jgi:hypothetical protein|nr:DUF4832 domain-containing protein [Oscillospiraceae bacterium]